MVRLKGYTQGLDVVPQVAEQRGLGKAVEVGGGASGHVLGKTQVMSV